jgi:putative tryptophan/tyrosine transport system substrate-binding protein
MQLNRLKRREFITLLGNAAAAWPLSAFAQLQGTIWRVGVLSIGSASTASHLVEAFFKAMAALGYQEGRNVRYEVRYGEGSIDKFEQYARELVSAKVDLIWASGTPAATAAQKATTSIPVVFALVGDPVYSKLVRNLTDPGANLTGMSLMISEMWEKRVEILTEVFPTVQRIGVLHNPLDSSNAAQLPYMQSGAQKLAKEMMIVGVRTPEEFGAAFAKLKGWGAQALLNAESTLFLTNKRALLDGAAQNRWPTVHSSIEYAEAGGVIAYGADYTENCRSSATYVGKIFSGTKPSDLPVEQPVKFEFVINLKSTNALGLTIPPSVLLRVDRVIE